MTTWLQMANAVRSRWDTEVTTGLSLPTQHDNAEFTEPTTKWCRLTLQPAATDQLELGAAPSRTFRTMGRAVAMIFLPLASGDALALSLADSIAALFRAQTVGGVTYFAPSIAQIGRSGEWWQLNVTIPFYTEALA